MHIDYTPIVRIFDLKTIIFVTYVRWVISTFSTEKKARTLLNFMCSWSPSPETKVKLEETYNKGLTELSFFLAANIPVEIDTKLALLQENSVDRRIDMMVEKLFKKMDIACVRCHTTIARAEDIFSVTAEGNSRHFVNNYGFVHEIITTTEAQHYAFRGPPDASFSWFEGYKWQIIECTMCLDHLGWEYTSKKYEPKSFFGLTRRSVALRERKDDQPISTEEQLSLVPDDVLN
ncbi:unnamed protein product, partial [Mesorhabditis belari]|uniref:CULT domain-containing protein n=1 Tax=Mesorhabditis belari TaxID=2138241 RepID=A0AAF3FLA6_9BILA